MPRAPSECFVFGNVVGEAKCKRHQNASHVIACTVIHNQRAVTLTGENARKELLQRE